MRAPSTGAKAEVSPAPARPRSLRRMRLPPAPRGAKLWLIWLLVVFGALNLCGSSLDAWRRPGDPAAVDDRTLRHRQTGAELMMTVLRDDNDIERYFAYAEAALGRPYAADFILPLGRAGFEGEPNPRRMTTPARPLVPWRDFVVEYPPGVMITALAPALVTSDADTYYRLFTLEAEAALTLAVWLAVKTAGRLRPDAGSQALAQAIFLTLALGVVAARRYDPFVALAMAAAVDALALRRHALGGAALGLAIALKGAPILLAPIFVIHAAIGRDWKALASGAAGGAIMLGLAAAAYVALAGPHALDAFAYHGQRPLQIETVYSGLLILARAFDPGFLSKTFGYGSLNAASPVEPALRALSTALLIGGVLGSWFYAWRSIAAARDDSERLMALVRASLACLVAYITLGKVFSPQYCVWLIPLAALAAPFSTAEARRLLPAAFLMVQAEYPFLYGMLYLTLVPATGALILMRTLFFWTFVTRTLEAFPARRRGIMRVAGGAA
jgi:Glycosyltransferase family 87